MAAKTFEQWWSENWESLDGYDREGYAQAAWNAATELAEEKFNISASTPKNKRLKKKFDFCIFGFHFVETVSTFRYGYKKKIAESPRLTIPEVLQNEPKS
jgi:hypothetical protein